MKERFIKLSLISSFITFIVLELIYLYYDYLRFTADLKIKFIEAIKIFDSTGFSQGYSISLTNQVTDLVKTKNGYDFSYLYNDKIYYLSSDISYKIDLSLIFVTFLIYIGIILVVYYLALYSSENFKNYLNSNTKNLNAKDPDLKDLGEDFVHLRNLSHNLREKVTELRSEQAKLDKIISNMIQGIILLDGTEKVILVNTNACKMFNLKSSIVGKDLLDELKNEQLLNQITDFTLSDSLNTHFLYDKLESTGVIYDVRLSKVKGDWIDDVTNEGYLIVVTDVTESYITNKIRADFIQNASHELKTPITSIRGYSELLMEDLVDKDSVKDIYAKINYNAIKMSNLISDILDLSKLERASMNIYKEDVMVYNLVEEIINNYDEKIKMRNLNVKLNISKDLIINTDKSILSIVLTNIISNAIKYNKPNGDIVISYECGTLKIFDNGIGISKENLERIFERFYRVNYDISGTGLGLSIAKHSLSLIDAKLEVDSQLGEYSEFRIIF